MDWNAVIIQSRPRGRSSGCWFRWMKKLWKSKGAREVAKRRRQRRASGPHPSQLNSGHISRSVLLGFLHR